MLFTTVARLRTLFLSLLILTPAAYCIQESLFTSSVTYCEPPESLLIQQFDIIYFNKNSSIWFNVSAASVESDLNVTANFFLNVYGMKPLNLTVELCDILGGVLCPLPEYNFIGSDSISLPSSLGISNQIPGIAFQIPDLEAYVQFTLTEVGTGKVKACVQATLSNGWSTRQAAVEWTTGGLTIVTLLFALYMSFAPDSLVPFRFLDLFYFFQSIAMTGFLSLNFPSLYRAFTLNFAWSMGFFSSSASSSMQTSIDNFRALTGGAMANSSAGSAVGLVNRKLSPYNEVGTNLASAQSFFASPSAHFADVQLPDVSSFVSLGVQGAQRLSTAGTVTTVTTSSDNVLQAGLPIYVNSIHVATANAFMTIFFSALILVAITLGTFALGYAALRACVRYQRGENWAQACLDDYPAFMRAWALRLCFIAIGPVMIFAFFQWTLKDSWLSVLFSVLLLLAVAFTIVYPVFVTVRIARHGGPESLYQDERYLKVFGPLYAQHRTPRYYFSLPLLAALFLKAVFISFAKANGGVQVIVIAIIELTVVLSYVLLKPAKTRGGDVFSTYLAIVRFVCSGLMIAFVEGFSVAAIPRVVIGVVILVLFSIAVIILYINLVVHAVRMVWPRKSIASVKTSDSLSEKVVSPTDTEVSNGWARPRNPTPNMNIPMDESILASLPDTPTPTTATTAQYSIATHESGSTALGSILPRRWSFAPDAPWDHPRESEEGRHSPHQHQH